ncbi:hypothetical protein LEP1GSC005_0531 [Leptospira santarosai str. ST188]|nr:hypothetical protein LEP1GSC005_0531 [Leptospira santarosai str. ST188]
MYWPWKRGSSHIGRYWNGFFVSLFLKTNFDKSLILSNEKAKSVDRMDFFKKMKRPKKQNRI